MFNRDKEMFSVFINEVNEILDNINTNLELIETNPTDKKAIGELLRYVHTLKGLFSTIEFKGFTELCHSTEDALMGFSKSGIIDSDSLAILFTFLNKLDEVYSFLSNLKPEDITSEDGDPFEELKKFDYSLLIRDLRELSSDTLNLGAKYRLIITLDSKCKLKSARAFQIIQTLEKISKILFSKPSKTEIDENISFSSLEFIIITHEEQAKLHEYISMIDEIEKIQIEILDIKDDLAEAAKKKTIATMQTVRVPLSHLDELMNLVGELVLERNSLGETLKLNSSDDQIFSSMDRTINELRRLILKTRFVPLEYIFDRFPRLIRDSSRDEKKKVEYIISGKYVEVDRTSIDPLNEALIHLIRNAIDHGIEKSDVRNKLGKPENGLIQISATVDRSDIVITIEDDGRGIDVQMIRDKAIAEGYITRESNLDRKALIALLFLSGFSTSEKVTNLSGRGIGLTIAYSNIVEKLNGSLDVETQKGKGTRFSIRIPTYAAITEALIVQVDESKFAIPTTNIYHVYRIRDEKIHYHNGRPVVVLNKEIIPVVSLQRQFNLQLLDENNETYSKEKIVIIWEQAGKFAAVLVNSILFQQKIVSKRGDNMMMDIKGFSGFTLIGDGNIIPILDPLQLIGAF